MLLVADVGNTETTLGLCEGEVITDHWRLTTDAQRTADEVFVSLRSLLIANGVEPGKVTAAAIGSVVPGVTAGIAAAAAMQRPLTRRGSGRSVSFSTAMTREGELHACRTADTEVFYMGGRQLAALAKRLLHATWSPETPVLVISRVGWPDQLQSDHTVATLFEAAALHSGRPTVVTVGAGAQPLRPNPPDDTPHAGLDTPQPAQTTLT